MNKSLVHAGMSVQNTPTEPTATIETPTTPVATLVSDKQTPAVTAQEPQTPKADTVITETKPPSTPEPKVEETTRVSSNAGAIVSTQAPTSTPAIEKPEYNFSNVLSQKFDGRFKTEDDLNNYIQKSDKPRIEFANDFVASLNQAIKSGVSEQEFAKAYFLDPDNMSDREAIRQKTRMENPGLSDAQLNRVLSKKYDADAEDEDAVADAKISENMDGSNAKRFLKEYKEKYKVEIPNNEQLQQEVAQREAAARDQIDQYVNSIDQHITNRGNQKYEVALNDAQKYTYTPSTDQLNEVKNQIADLSTFFNRYQGEDGAAKLFDEMFFAMNHEKVLRSMSQAINNDGKKEILNTLTNPGNLDPATRVDAGAQQDSIALQAARQIF